MANYSLNCEAFSVRMGDVTEPQVSRGLPVKRVNWSDGEFVPYEDRFYVDLAAYPGNEENMLSDERAGLTIALNEASPPEIRHEHVYDFSLPAEILRDPQSKGNFDVPLRLSKQVAQPIGKAALVRIIDFSPYSLGMGNADIVDKSNSIVLGELRTDHASENAGVTAILIPDGCIVTVRQVSKGFKASSYFSLNYIPESIKGIYVDRRMLGEEGPFIKEDDGPKDAGDGGGSDREPRHPLIPHMSGAAEAEIPPFEDEEEVSAISSLELEEFDEQRAQAG